MNIIFEQAIDVAFDKFGIDGVFKEVPVKVLRTDPDSTREWEQASISSPSNFLQVRVKDIPTPEKGDEILVGKETYLIEAQPQRDQHRLVWYLDVVEK